MIKQNINFSQFCDSFSEERKNTFTYDGKRALFDYLEQYSEDTGADIELDIIALCCEYSEFEDIADYLASYSTDIDRKDYDKDEDGTEEYNKAIMEEIGDKTQVIPIENSEAFIIAQY